MEKSYERAHILDDKIRERRISLETYFNFHQPPLSILPGDPTFELCSKENI